jgi:hypothetical protein
MAVPPGAPGTADASGREGETPAIHESYEPTDRTCRCGTKIRASQTAYEVRRVPPRLVRVFDGVGFCSLPCIRAYFLERLEEVDSMESADGDRLSVELRVTYDTLSAEFARLIDQWAFRLRKSAEA